MGTGNIYALVNIVVKAEVHLRVFLAEDGPLWAVALLSLSQDLVVFFRLRGYSRLGFLSLRRGDCACRLGDGVYVSLLVVVELVLMLAQRCCTRAACALVGVFSRAEAVLRRASSQDVLRAHSGLPGQGAARRRLQLYSEAGMMASSRTCLAARVPGQPVTASEQAIA